MTDRSQIESRSAPGAPSRLGERVAGASAYSTDWTDERALSGYWSILWKRKALIFVVSLLGTLAGLAAGLPQAPVYQATASLEVAAPPSDSVRAWHGKPSPAPNRSWTEFYIATRAEILESRLLLERVFETLQLDRRLPARSENHRWPALSGFLNGVFKLGAEKTGLGESGLAVAKQSYKVVPARKAGIIEIVSEWPDAKLSADFANTLAREFIILERETRWQAAERTEQWLDRQLQELRIQLETSEEELRRYARETGLLFTSGDESVAEQRLRQLQAELSRAQADRIAKQSRYELIATRDPRALGDLLDIHEYEIRRVELRRQLAELGTTHTRAHYKVKRVEAQLAEIEKTIEAERGNRLEQIRNEFETAERRERLLAADYRKQSSLVSEQAGKSVQYNILTREVDTYRQLYDHLLRQVKEAGVLAAMSAGDIRIADPATVPVSPIRPDHGLNLLLGLALGMLSGVTLAFVAERRDRTLREPGESRDYLQLPELGAIPASDQKYRFIIRVRRRRNNRLHSVGNGSRRKRSSPNLRLGTNDIVELASWQEKPSVLAECFRVATTSVLFLAPDALQRLVVTSPHPSEGKTTVASNLAITLAEIHGRVLLVDADLRRPRLHEIFDVPNEWGFADLLEAKPLRTDDGADAFGFRTGVPGLYLLPSGGARTSITNLLHSPRAADLFSRLQAAFSIVVFDSPPMMEFSEARVLGQLSDGVVLVLRAGVTSRDDARAAREKFAEDGTRVLGTVLNCWHPRNGVETVSAYYQSYAKETAAHAAGSGP